MNDTVYGVNTSARTTMKNIAVQTDDSKSSISPKWDRHLFYQILHIGIDYVLSPHNVELKIFMVTIVTMMICMFVYFRAQVSGVVSPPRFRSDTRKEEYLSSV